MKVREKVPGRIIVALVAVAVAAVLVGCPNLSRDLDLKAQIEEDVREANADQVSIRVIPGNEAMGMTSPYGDTTVKVGVAFQISTSVFSEYAFVRWEKTPGDGEVAFEDASSTETTATVTRGGADIVIRAVFDARPKIIIKDPDSGQTGVLRNKTISITFSEDLDALTVSPDTASSTKSIGVSTAASITGPFVPLYTLDVSCTGPTITIAPRDEYNQWYYVLVTVRKSVQDRDGYMMKEDNSWYFKTGNSVDVADPVISAFYLKSGGAALPADWPAKSRNIITIHTDASDDGGLDTLTLRVTETAIDAAGNPIPGVDNEKVSNWQFEQDFIYPIQTPDDGRKRLQVVAVDSVGHESDPLVSPPPATIVLDTIPPVVSSTTVNGGAGTATGTTVSVSIDATDAGSSVAGYQVSEDPAFTGMTTWQPWTSTPQTASFVLSSGDGPKMVYVRVRDSAGNMNAATANDRDDIVLDAVGPTFSSKVTINGGATTTTSTTVSVSINATDAGSSVAGYQVSEDPAFTGMTTWQPWTSTPQTASFVLSGGDGLKTVYVRVRDASSHINGATTDDRNTITLDAAGPTFSSKVTINGGATTTTSTTVSVSINATDAGSSVAGYQVSEDPAFTGMTTWQPWTSTPQTASFVLSGGDGLKTVYVRVRDANSHINGATTDDRNTISLDLLAPVFGSKIIINGGAGTATGTTVSVSIDATDAGSSVAGYQVSEDPAFTGMTTWQPWTATPQTASFVLSSGDGPKMVYGRVRDANNHINGATTDDRDDIVLDAVGPTFSSKVTINGGATTTTSTTVSVSINATDAGSSVAGYQVSEDPAFTGMTTWQPWTSTPQTASFVLSGGDGLKTVYVRVRDASSHINGATTDDRNTITLDAAGPTFSSKVTINGGATTTTSTTVSVSINATDAGSSVAGYQVSEDPAFTGMTTWQPWTSTPQTASFVLSSGDGPKTVYVRVRDANSHINGATTDDRNTISLDTVGPTFSSTVSINSGAARTGSATISMAISASDAGSSIAEYQLSEASDFSGGTTTLWTAWAGSPVSFTLSAGDGTKNVYVKLKDQSGHESTETTQNHDDIILDTAAPVVNSVTMAADNLTAVVAFNENIYGDASQGDLATTALTVVILSGSAQVETESTARTGAAEATVTITWKTGKAPVTGDSIGIQASSATSVYDYVGNAMAAAAGGSGSAKRLSFAAAAGSSVGTTVQTVLATFRGGSSFPLSSQTQGGRAPATSGVSVAPRTTPASIQPLAQFYRPIRLDATVTPTSSTVAAPVDPAASSVVARSVATRPAPAAGTGASAAILPAGSAQVDLPEMATLALFEVQAQEIQQTSAPWLVIGLTLGAALLLAAGMLVARLLRRGAPSK